MVYIAFMKRNYLFLFLTLAPALLACNEHIIPRSAWPQLNGFSTDKPKLVKAEGGMMYITSLIPLALVKKYGRIRSRFTSIRFVKGQLMGLTATGRRIQMPLKALIRIIAFGKLAGVITGKKEESRQDHFRRPMSPGMRRY